MPRGITWEPGEEPVCAVESCDRRAYTRGWCSTHYDRWKRLGDVQADRPLRSYSPGAVCSVEGCGLPHLARGLCKSHYYQARLRNDG